MSRTLSKLRLIGASAALAAGFAMQPVAAQTVSDTGKGSAVVVPYYTVKGGWETLINVTNTTGNSLAVKVRLHDHRNSRDVLDFNLALSPYDVWTATIRQDANGRAFLRTTDRSCTSPLSVATDGLAANEIAYSTVGSVTFRDHDGTANSIERLQEGYITLLVMGEDERPVSGPGVSETGSSGVAGATRGTTAYYAKHVNGVPRDCARVDADFQRQAGIPVFTANDAVNGVTIPGENGSGNPLARAGWTFTAPTGGIAAGQPNPFGYGPVVTPDPLKVNVSLINSARGLGAGVESLHIAGYAVGVNNVTAQQFPYFLEPTLASGDGLWTTTNLATLEAGIAATSVANEWTENRSEPGVRADAEWVVTFPTKRYHVDEDSRNIQAACSQYRHATSGGGVASGGGGPAYAGFAPIAATPSVPTQLAAGFTCPLAPFTERFQAGNNGVSNIELTYTFYDREEREAVQAPDTTVPSPFPPGIVEPDNLSFEANVVKIGPNARTRTSVLGTANALGLPTNDLPGAETGWLRIDFADGAAYPTAGFILKVRDFGDPTINFAQATEHAYTRP
ncbi:hypothetical protein [Sinimarinibacterium thermocellulolyticum]|uniref:Uncharacterized protein n=1 Tax=Sinimarinibacterium thermocellulolyticum TaxID=3170016 RepID=A0ABV2ADU2_9GAMM